MANTAFTHDPTITVPGSSTANAIVTWNGTTGKSFSNSTIIVGSTTMGLAADTDLLTFGSGTLAITGTVTGITTITATTFSGALSGNATSATTLANARTIGGTSFDGSQNIAVGLAGTATLLANARTIGGVSFNGSAAINLPGVNTAGDQNTSGTAAGLSTALVVASGGTNTTSYTKGDVLIASAGTTLTKLGIGSNTHVLTADSNEATGVKWAAGGGALTPWTSDIDADGWDLITNDSNEDINIIPHGTGKVGLGTASPEAKLHVFTGDSSLAPGSGAILFCESNTAECYIDLHGAADATGGFRFGVNGGAANDMGIYMHPAQLDFRFGSTLRFRLASGGDLNRLGKE